MTPFAKRYSPKMRQSGHQKARIALRLLKRACSLAQASNYCEREYGQFNKLTCTESDEDPEFLRAIDNLRNCATLNL
jgi:hypothetical protein